MLPLRLDVCFPLLGLRLEECLVPGAAAEPILVSMSEENNHLCPVSCPDCNGVLSIETSTGQPLSFRCQIGHRYSMSSGIRAKEDQLEHTLRSAAVQLTHLQHLYQLHLQDSDLIDSDRQQMTRRLAEVTEQRRSILAVIEESHAVA